MSSEWKFKVGEKVKSILHDNSPTLTIRKLEEYSFVLPHITSKTIKYGLFFEKLEYYTEYKTHYGKIGYTCSWFDNNKNYHEHIFKEDELKGVNDESSDN